jgi:hypothetical protein
VGSGVGGRQAGRRPHLLTLGTLTVHGPTTTLPAQRELFDIPDDVAYFNCANLAPQLRSARAAAEAAPPRRTVAPTCSASACLRRRAGALA